MGGKRNRNRGSKAGVAGAGSSAAANKSGAGPSGSSTPQPRKQDGESAKVRLDRYKAALEKGSGLGAMGGDFDALLAPLPSPGKKDPNLNSVDIINLNAAAKGPDGESAMDSEGHVQAVPVADVLTSGGASDTAGRGEVVGQPGSGGPEMGPAATDGNIPKGKWKGKFWAAMTQEERLTALAERKAEQKAKIDERDRTQAEWIRAIHPVVNDDDPAGFQRILLTMGISEVRIRQTSTLYAKLLDEG